jgi:hypothetical protein
MPRQRQTPSFKYVEPRELSNLAPRKRVEYFQGLNGMPQAVSFFATQGVTLKELATKSQGHELPSIIRFLTTNDAEIQSWFNSYSGSSGAAVKETDAERVAREARENILMRQGAPPSRMVGKGLARHIDNSAGIKAGARYVPFGKFVIQNHRLMDNVVAVRRPKGSNITAFPSQRVSHNVGHIIRTIVGGGHPTFDNLNELREDEKTFLHKLVKGAGIQDKISVPSPSRDEEDRDTNAFNIMRGELMSGNDSVEMIKKFKILLLKLTNNGMIPRGQSKEIMCDLLQMGF